MEKAKKILYLISGIIKTVIGGLGTLLGLLVFLINGLIKEVFLASKETLQEMAEELASIDESYKYLVDASVDTQIDFVMNVCKIFAIVVIIIALINIALGILNIIFAKKTGTINKEKPKSIWLCIACWVCSFLFVSTILTTIAVCLRRKKKKTDSDEVIIESYHV